MQASKRFFGPLTAALAVALLLGACDAIGITGHDELSLERRPYLGDGLRVDGYYYTSYPTAEGTRYTAYLLYRNGVIRYGGNSVDLATIEEKIALYGDRRYHWGVFHVEGDRITYEMWYPPSKTYTRTFVNSGQIINDTTFVITESWHSSGSDRRSKEETYLFRAFAPKPDSTNRYVE